MNSNNMDWKQVHNEAIIVDLHAHPTMKALLFGRPLKKRLLAPGFLRGKMNPLSLRTSFPNLQDGEVDIQFSTIYPPERQLLEDVRIFGRIKPLVLTKYLPVKLAQHVWKTYLTPDYFSVTLSMLEGMEDEIDKYNQGRDTQLQREVTVIRNREELADYESQLSSGTKQKHPIAIIHSVEGGHGLLGPKGTEVLHPKGNQTPSYAINDIRDEIFDNLATLAEKGVGYIIPAHFYNNHIAEPTFPFPEDVAQSFIRSSDLKRMRDQAPLTKGLTDLGKAVINRMLELGIFIDVTHATPRARHDIYQLVEAHKPTIPSVIATHVGAYAINPSPYNLEDWEIKWIADHGGVVGVIFMTYWLMPHETKFGLNYISRHIEHIFNVGGESAVAMGTDFDGADPPDDLLDSSELHYLTHRLLGEYHGIDKPKYSSEQIKKFLGGNVIETFKTGWGYPI